MLNNLDEKFDTFVVSNSEQHQSIQTHVEKTNGRVTRLERYRDMLIGGMVLINVVVLPVFFFIVFKYLGSK